VSKWEGQFDREAMLAAFRGETTTPEPSKEATEPPVPVSI